jgi:hypothetical protein
MCQNYSELFINQFIQTLAQLSAVIISGSLGIPVYNYYIKSYKNQINNNENDVVLVNENNDNDNDSDSIISSDTSTFTDDVNGHQGTDDTLPMDNLNDQQFRMEESDIINH